MNTAVIGATSGAVFGLIGVLIGQCLTQRRHSEALRQTAELEEQRAHKDALLKYFEVVGQLLSEPSEADYLSPILRAQTLTLLEALGPDHKRILLQFLYELSLLGPEKPGLSLKGANLREAKLAGANLGETSLERVHLERANLAEANLVGANLRRTNLREANLKEADLSRAFLQVITKEDSLKRRSMRRSETMLPSSQTTSSASRTGEAVWKEELEES